MVHFKILLRGKGLVADFLSVRRLTLCSRSQAPGTRRVFCSIPSRAARRGEGLLPRELREKVREVYFQVSQPGSWRRADPIGCITWRTCPGLAGRAVLEETK